MSCVAAKCIKNFKIISIKKSVQKAHWKKEQRISVNVIHVQRDEIKSDFYLCVQKNLSRKLKWFGDGLGLAGGKN